MNRIFWLFERGATSFIERKYASLTLWLSPPLNVLLLWPSFIYERPTIEQTKADILATTPTHPRILATSSDFARIKSLRETDTNNFDMCRDVDTSINYLKNCFSYSDINIKFTDKEMKHFNSKDQYKGTVVDSIFYYGRTLLKIDGVQYCDYSDAALRGEIYESTITPFISTEIPSELANYHELFRDEDGNISLGDFLKINEEFVKAAFGENISLGANLS